jgi:hypothetical protein
MKDVLYDCVARYVALSLPDQLPVTSDGREAFAKHQIGLAVLKARRNMYISTVLKSRNAKSPKLIGSRGSRTSSRSW